MSGSQPATVGELHPLHRKALRHPLILDGLSDSAPRLAALDVVGTCPGTRPSRLHLAARPEQAGTEYCACTFYLVFKEPDFLAELPVASFSLRGTLQSY